MVFTLYQADIRKYDRTKILITKLLNVMLMKVLQIILSRN